MAPHSQHSEHMAEDYAAAIRDELAVETAATTAGTSGRLLSGGT
jgi:hypothetical protein